MSTYINPLSTCLIKLGKGIYVSLFTFLALFAFIFCDISVYTFLVLFALIIHESGHILALRLCGIKPSELYIYPFGLDMKADTSKLSYYGEAAVMGAGIVTNVIMFLLSFSAGNLFSSKELLFFAYTNLFFALTNIIPSSAFDGGRILLCLLCQNLSFDKAQKISHTVSSASYILICVGGVWLFFLTDCNLTVVILCCYAALSAFLAERLMR